MSVLPAIQLQSNKLDTLREIPPYFVPISVEHMQATEEKDIPMRHPTQIGSQQKRNPGPVETPMRQQHTQSLSRQVPQTRDEGPNWKEAEQRNKSRTVQGDRYERSQQLEAPQELQNRSRSKVRAAKDFAPGQDRRPSPISSHASTGDRPRYLKHRDQLDELRIPGDSADSFDEPHEVRHEFRKRQHTQQQKPTGAQNGRPREKESGLRREEYIREERTPIYNSDARIPEAERSVQSMFPKGRARDVSQGRSRANDKQDETPLDRIERELDRQERYIQIRRPGDHTVTDSQSGPAEFIYERYEEIHPVNDGQRGGLDRSLSKKRVTRESRREITVIREQEEDYDVVPDTEEHRQSILGKDRDERIMIGDYGRGRRSRPNN